MSTGRVKDLSMRIAALTSLGSGAYAAQLKVERDQLLTNGGRPPIPTRMLNQRQKRKRAKW